MTHHQTFRARPLRALAAALAVVAVSLVAATHASARSVFSDPHCRYDGVSFNACLSFDSPQPFVYNAQVGIDVYLPEQYGREIVACGGNFRASLWGDDDPKDTLLRDLFLKPGWPVAGRDGIAAEFLGRGLLASDIDEDGGEDELVARVSFFDCHTGLTRTFLTGIIRGEFRG